MAKTKMTITIKDEDFDDEIQGYLKERLREYARDQIKPVIETVVTEKIEKQINQKVANYLNEHSNYSVMEKALSDVVSQKVNEAFDIKWSNIPSEKVERMITDKVNEIFNRMDIERVIQENIKNAVTILIEKNLKDILKDNL